MELLSRFVRFRAAGWALIAAVVAVSVSWWLGYDAGRDSRAEEISAISAVGAAQSRRARAITLEVFNAQQAHLAVWRRARADAAAGWLQLDRDRAGRVPTVCAQPGGTAADRGDGLAAAGEAGAGDVLAATLDALRRGEEIEATLHLCQAELRQCAGMR